MLLMLHQLQSGNTKEGWPTEPMQDSCSTQTLNWYHHHHHHTDNIAYPYYYYKNFIRQSNLVFKCKDNDTNRAETKHKKY